MALPDIFGQNQTLKNYSSKTMNFNNDMAMHVQDASWSKMYRRSMFNVSANLNGINAQFSSCYASNIFDVSLTINADGLKFGEYGKFQIEEFYVAVREYFTTSVIYSILNPHDLILVSQTESSDEDGETTLVNDNGYVESYIKTSFSMNKTYRVYFPRVSWGGVADVGVDQEDDVEDILNQNKIYNVSLSCQDKLYTLKASSLT